MGFFDSIASFAAPILGSVVGGPVGGAVGAAVGNQIASSQEQERQQAAAQADRNFQEDIFNRNVALQREFAQSGLSWKVQDAKNAGLHPLVAIGGAGASYSPQSISVGSSYTPGPDYASMGQNVARAALAAQDQTARLQSELLSAQIDGVKLDNSMKAQRIQSSQIGPALNTTGLSNSLISGQGNSSKSGSGLVELNPLSRTHSAPGAPHSEVGEVADYGFARTPTGLAIVPSQDVKNRIEDQIIPELAWSFRNQILPTISGGGPTPPDPRQYPLPKGFDEWRFNPFMQEFQPARSGESFAKKWWKNWRK